jgi:cytochrome P450
MQFLHVLFLFPDVADRVFQEIFAVTQGQRLPLISDRPQLPYTEATWKEAVRWSPFLPLGQ